MYKARKLREYKLSVFGVPDAGKKSLTFRFTHGRYLEYECDSGIEDSITRVYLIDNEEVQLSIAVPFGQIVYPVINVPYMVHSDGFLLVYSIASESSFQRLDQFYEQIVQVRGRDTFPVVVVGQKCDLEYERQVPANSGRELARKLDCPFFETSAKMGINVEAAMVALIHEIKRHEQAASDNISPPVQASTSTVPDREHILETGCRCIIG